MTFLRIPGLLSAEECDRVRLDVDARLGEDEEDDDNGDGVYARARGKDAALTGLLEARLAAAPDVVPFLPEGWHVHHMLFFTRYRKGGHIGPHVDGTTFDVGGGFESALTLLVYVNDGYEGGETVRVYGDDDLPEDRDVQTSPPPVTAGDALLLSQDVMHEARPVAKGVKYLLRADVMTKLLRKV